MISAIEKSLTEKAFALGFSLVGFVRIRPLDERREFFRQWIADGRPAEMGWLKREPERRFDPRKLDPRLKSVISLAYPYEAPHPPIVDWGAELRGRIASYAIGFDYHELVLKKARILASTLLNERSWANTRVYVDTGPVFEREWAAEARLGWFGRNTNLINRYNGSYFFLAEIFTDVEFDAPTEPYREHCGTCRKCLDLCPTSALADGYLLEPRLCISYLTIEHRGPIPRDLRPKLSNWIFGCDICQEVCPWNSDPAAAAPVNDDLAPRLSELMLLDSEGFSRRFTHSAIKRAKRRGLLRNAAIALGNSGNPAAAPILARVLHDEREALVRGHSAWALGRLDTAESRRALEAARSNETDLTVLSEIEDALDGFGG